MIPHYKHLIFVCCGNLFEFHDFCTLIGPGDFIYRTSFLKKDMLFIYINDPLKLKGTKPAGIYFYGNYANQDYESIYEEYKIRTRDARSCEEFIAAQRIETYSRVR